MSVDNSALAALIKENVRSGIADAAFRRTDLINLLGSLGRVRSNVGNGTYSWEIVTAANSSVEVFSEGQAPPVAGNQTYKRPTLSPFYVRGVFGFSGHVRDNIEKGAFYDDPAMVEEALLKTDVMKKAEDVLLNSTQDQGIAAIIDSTGTYAGLSQASVSQWASEENAVGGALTYSAMQDLYEEMISPSGGSSVPRGASPTHWLMPTNQLGNYLALAGFAGQANAAPRFSIGQSPVDFGFSWSGASFSGVPIVVVSGITSTEIYLIDAMGMELVIHRDLRMDEIVTNPELKQFQVSMGLSLAVNLRNHHGKMTGVTA